MKLSSCLAVLLFFLIPARLGKWEPHISAYKVKLASWYGAREHGHYTASGERFNMYALTAASWQYPFGSRVLVRSLRTGREVVVRINDRGPARRLHRDIDLSYAAAQRLGMIGVGLDKVLVSRLGR